MHELSIAVNIVEMIEDNAVRENVNKVEKFEIDVGVLSGVIVGALEFALEEAVKDSICSKAIWKINEIEAKARCRKCSHVYCVKDYISQCPKCDGFSIEILQGKEIQLKSITVE